MGFNIGYEPTNIVSLPDAPDDFDEFWAKAKEELATVPGDFKLTELTAKSGKKRKMYLAEMRGLRRPTLQASRHKPSKIVFFSLRL